MQVKITEKTLDSQAKAAKAQGKPVYVWDTELRGFGCYVTPAEKVSFLFQHWIGGKGGRPNRFVIGHRPLSVSDARKRAEEYKAQSSKSTPVVSPKQERITLEREARSAARLNDVWLDYEKDHHWKSESHRSHTKSYFENDIIPTLKKDTAIRDITKEDISSIIKTKKRKHPIAARYLFRVLSPFFSYCVQEGYIPLSPMIGMKPPPASDSGERSLSEAEIVSFWKATDGNDCLFDPFHRLLLLTGQRRDEVSGMAWSEIDTKTGEWTIPAKRAKNKSEHVVYLCDLALQILGTLPVTDNDLIFTTTGITPISGYGRAKERLDAELDIPHWTLHDLRRTFDTQSGENELASDTVIDAALNHKKRGLRKVYNRAQYLRQRRELFVAWGEYIDSLVSPRTKMQSNSCISHRGLTNN
jgi:integrase